MRKYYVISIYLSFFKLIEMNIRVHAMKIMQYFPINITEKCPMIDITSKSVHEINLANRINMLRVSITA